MTIFDGQRMAALRKTRGLTGLELARLVHCSNVTVSRIENGHQQPTSALSGRIAEALGVPLDELTIDPRRAVRRDGDNDTDTERLVVEALRRMDPLLRAQTIGYILGVASSGSPDAAVAAANLAAAAEEAKNRDQGQGTGG